MFCFIGVLLCLVKAAVRLERVQAAVLEQLASCLHCSDCLEQLAPLTIRLVNRERLAAMTEASLIKTAVILFLETFSRETNALLLQDYFLVQ